MPVSTLAPTLVAATHPIGMVKFAALLALGFAVAFISMVLIGNERHKRRLRRQSRPAERD